MRVKASPATFDTAEDGAIEAIVSVFNNVDSYGDVVLPGAFTETVGHWKSSGDTLPVLWSHRTDDPIYNIGSVEDIEELSPGDARLNVKSVDPFVRDNGGLWVRARIDTGDDASPIAKQALRLLKSRRVTQFSFAYEVLDGGPIETKSGGEAYGLKRLKLYEVSPTQVGANELTELIAAKARQMQSRGVVGRDERRRIADALAELKSVVDVADDDNTATDTDTLGDDDDSRPKPPDEPARRAKRDQHVERIASLLTLTTLACELIEAGEHR